MNEKGNMYHEAFTWNPAKGCNWNCSYCKSSFQRQAKRQKPVIDKNGKKRGCQDCYDYKPHFHHERLKQSLPNTVGDQFIFTISSGDIACMEEEWINQILDRIRELPHKTFFFQTKSPDCYYKYEFPDNLIIGITLETDKYESHITDAMEPWRRFRFFNDHPHPRKFVTIEPILQFTHWRFLKWLQEINPERIYIGYDTKKNRLNEPSLEKTRLLIKELRKFTTVKTKYMKGDCDKIIQKI